MAVSRGFLGLGSLEFVFLFALEFWLSGFLGFGVFGIRFWAVFESDLLGFCSFAICVFISLQSKWSIDVTYLAH